MPRTLTFLLSCARESRSGWTSTRVASREAEDRPYSMKRVTFPASSAQSNSRRRQFSVLPPPFPSLTKPSQLFSAACSQARGFGFEAEECELPDEDATSTRTVPVIAIVCRRGCRDDRFGICPRPSPYLSIPCLSPSPSSHPSVRCKCHSACVPSSRWDKSNKDPKDGSVRKRAQKKSDTVEEICGGSV